MNAVIGFDIGTSSIHIAVCQGTSVRQSITEALPDDLVRDGKILSYEAMSDFLKALRKEHHLSGRNVAVVLPDQLCFCRRLTVPAMTVDQLGVNLPYEFRDYTTMETDKYYYDYALVNTIPGEDGTPHELDLMAAATLKDTITNYAEMFQRAGMRLQLAVPVEMAYINLLRTHFSTQPKDGVHSHCILDLGHDAIRIYMFTGDQFEVLRVIDYGCNALEQAIADELHLDIHAAHNNLITNHNQVQQLPCCQRLYSSIAVEILKAINFYGFNNSDKELTHIHCCGGGTYIPALLTTLTETLPLPLVDVSELLPKLTQGQMDGAASMVAAAGCAIQEGGRR